MSETARDDLIPASSLHELYYCPRNFYYAHVLGDESVSAPLARGRAEHEAVDDPKLAGRRRVEHGVVRTRALPLASASLGLTAKVDVVDEEASGEVCPVEHKSGKGNDPPWESDRAQVGAHILLLRDAGLRCDRGYVFYRGSRRRVEVPWTPELEALVRDGVARARALRAPEAQIPPVLEDRYRCAWCRYLGVCLPEEEAYVKSLAVGASAAELGPAPVRVVAGKADGEVLYLDKQGLKVSVKGETLEMRSEGEVVARQPLNVLDAVVVVGMIHLTAPVLSTLLVRDVPVSFLGTGGRYKGALTPACSKNGILRQRQALASAAPAQRLTYARQIVAGKVWNQRAVVQRAARRRGDERRLDRAASMLERLARRAEACPSLEAALGVEGSAARLYFAAFGAILGSRRSDPALRFERRSRRPPRDPVNALLSFVYALVTADVTAALHTVGLDPFVGLYHGQRYGQPALALDLVEELRPALADSVVLRLVNNGEVTSRDFLAAPTSTALTEAGRKRVLAAYAERKESEVVHPVFGYRITWRRAIEVQARMLAKALQGETAAYVPFAIR